MKRPAMRLGRKPTTPSKAVVNQCMAELMGETPRLRAEKASGVPARRGWHSVVAMRGNAAALPTCGQLAARCRACPGSCARQLARRESVAHPFRVPRTEPVRALLKGL